MMDFTCKKDFYSHTFCFSHPDSSVFYCASDFTPTHLSPTSSSGSQIQYNLKYKPNHVVPDLNCLVT